MVPGTARQLHPWRHLKEPSSIGGRKLTCELAIVNWEWNVISRHDNVRERPANYSELSWCSRQVHPWRHLKEPSSIGGRKLAHELTIVILEWNITLRQHNVKEHLANYLELSKPLGAARQLHLWRHLKDPLSNGGRELKPKMAIVNGKWDGKLRQSNIKVCHLNHSKPSWRQEQPVNCIFDDI